MFRWAIVFLFVALVAALFGFTDLAGVRVGAAQMVSLVFFVLFVGALLLGLRGSRRDVLR